MHAHIHTLTQPLVFKTVNTCNLISILCNIMNPEPSHKPQFNEVIAQIFLARLRQSGRRAFGARELGSARISGMLATYRNIGLLGLES